MSLGLMTLSPSPWMAGYSQSISILSVGGRVSTAVMEDGKERKTNPSKPYWFITATKVLAKVVRPVAVETCVEKYLFRLVSVSARKRGTREKKGSRTGCPSTLQPCSSS